MQYSLHLQFSDTKDECSIDNMEHRQNKIPCRKKDKVCEKCNYVHLVHCPIMEMICDRQIMRQKPKIKRVNQNRSSQFSSSEYKDPSPRLMPDSKYLNTDDEIKIEGILAILPLFSNDV